MANIDFEVTKGTTFSELCSEIINRSTSKKDQLDMLYSDIRQHIKTPNDAQVFLPRIKELLDTGIKNDEQLIKLASVLQRLQSTQLESSGGEDGTGLSDEEKDQLMQTIATAKITEIKKDVDAPIPPLSSSIA
jgi:hypothetical protein